jgi:hypothetical protein
MFQIDYNYFINNEYFNTFKVFYMPGLKVSDIFNSKCVINIDTKTVYIYH